jgi:hypothetical protein
MANSNTRKYMRKHNASILQKVDTVALRMKELVAKEFLMADEVVKRDVTHAIDCAVATFKEEMDEEYNVSRIVSHRFKGFETNGELEFQLEFDVRYEGYESQSCWQPYENIKGVYAFRNYVLRHFSNPKSRLSKFIVM